MKLQSASRQEVKRIACGTAVGSAVLVALAALFGFLAFRKIKANKVA